MKAALSVGGQCTAICSPGPRVIRCGLGSALRVGHFSPGNLAVSFLPWLLAPQDPMVAALQFQRDTLRLDRQYGRWLVLGSHKPPLLRAGFDQTLSISRRLGRPNTLANIKKRFTDPI